MTGSQYGYLFETSWEVCNKVGGIYTVITSKVREALAAYGDQYFLLGPDLKTNLEVMLGSPARGDGHSGAPLPFRSVEDSRRTQGHPCGVWKKI
jgi:hypothetical protein